MNIILGPREERVLMTGLHAVSDIRCKNCLSTVGWKYERVSLGDIFCDSNESHHIC